MKHMFIINPAAGAKDSTSTLLEKLSNYDDVINYQVYITKGVGDATKQVKEICSNATEEIRFYACGGDGTLNEVVEGMADCKLASVCHFPSGTANDFIKSFDNTEDFYDIDKLINSKEEVIDLIKVDGQYSINICNFGIDAKVCEVMNKIRRKPIIGKKNAYTTAILYCLLFARTHYCEMTVDGKKIYEGKMNLGAVANGKIYGGGYCCAPTADLQDGKLDICLLKPVPLLKLASCLNIYKNGEHLTSEKMAPYLYYLQGEKIEINAPKGIALCLDGEVVVKKHFTIEIIKNGIKFAVPVKDENSSIDK